MMYGCLRMVEDRLPATSGPSCGPSFEAVAVDVLLLSAPWCNMRLSASEVTNKEAEAVFILST